MFFFKKIKKMRRIVLSLVYLFFCNHTYCQSNNSYGIDNDVWSLFQTNSLFFKDVRIIVPEECSRKLYSDLIQNPDMEKSLAVNVYLGQNTIDNNMRNRQLIPFLVSQSLAEIKLAIKNTYNNSECVKFLFYTSKGKNLITKYNDEATNISTFKLNIGKRKFIAVTYKNRYEDITAIGKRDYYIFRYKYQIENRFLEGKNLPVETYEGHFKVYLNPDNGKWKIAEDELVNEESKSIIKVTYWDAAPEKKEIDRLVRAYPNDLNSSNCDSIREILNEQKRIADENRRIESEQRSIEQEREMAEALDNASLFFKIPNTINGKTSYLKVLPLVNNSNNQNGFNYFKAQTFDLISGLLRYRSSTKEDFEKADKADKYELKINFNDFQFRNMSQQANILDWQAEAYFDYILTKGGEVNRKETLVYKGGDPMFADTKDQAQAGLTIALQKWNKIIAYLCFNTQCNIMSIEEEDKKKVRMVILDNADYLDVKAPIGFVFYKKGTNVVVGLNSLNAVEAVAKGEIKKTENGKVYCKITDGGEKLKELLASDEKIIAISTFERITDNLKIR